MDEITPEPEPGGSPTGPRTPAPKPGLDLHILDSDRWLTAPHASRLDAAARHALDLLGFCGCLSVRLVDDERMADDHEAFMGVEGTTDVLTFDLTEPGSDRHEVDILISGDEAQRQAARAGHDPDREILLYIVHGVLHCMGFDDHDEDAARAMHAREDEVLTAIGVGPVFAAAPDRKGAG